MDYGWAGSGSYLTAPLVVLTSELTGLSSSTGDVLAVGPSFANAQGAVWADVEFIAGSAISPSADAFVEVWILRSLDSGQTFEDGSATAAPARAADVTIPIIQGTGIIPHAGMPGVMLPPGTFRVALRNQMGVAIPAGSSVRLAVYAEAGIDDTAAVMTGDANGTQAFRIADMMERFGVVTYSQSDISVNPWGAGTSDYTTSSVIQALTWLTANSGMICNIREYHVAGADTDLGSGQLTWCPAVASAIGAKFAVSLLRGATTTDAATLVGMATSSANGTGWMSWAEGLNTPNDGSVLPTNCIPVQQAIYTGCAATQSLAHPVAAVSPSFTYATVPPESAVAITGYLTAGQKTSLLAASTLASVRYFPTLNPAYDDSASRGGNADDVAVGFANYYGKPLIIGEWHPTSGNTDSPSHATDDSFGAFYAALMMLHAHRLGYQAWFWKSLFDIGRTGESPWVRVGLFPNAGSDTPRLPARTIRAMYALTGDTGANKRTFRTSRLDYSISGLQAPGSNATPWTGGHHRLYQNSGGTFFLFVWNEQRPILGAASTITLAFGRSMARVVHYDLTTDPTTAETAVLTTTNTTSFNFTLTASVHLFVISPLGSTGPTESAQDASLTTTVGAIYDANGVAYTLVSNPPFGLQVNHAGLTDLQNVVLLFYHDHIVWAQNSSGVFQFWNGTSWVVGTDPRIVATESADGLTISGPGTTIYASQTPGSVAGSTLDQWTMTSGGQMAKGGVTDGTTANVIQAYYHLHTVFHQATTGNAFGTPGWWSWNGSVWVACASPLGATESAEGTLVSTVGPIIYASQTPGQSSVGLDLWTLAAYPTVFATDFTQAQTWFSHQYWQSGDQWSYVANGNADGLFNDSDTWWANPITTPGASSLYSLQAGGIRLGLMVNPGGLGISQSNIGALIGNQLLPGGNQQLFGYFEITVSVQKRAGFLFGWDFEDLLHGVPGSTWTTQLNLDIWTDGSNVQTVWFHEYAGGTTLYLTTSLDATVPHAYGIDWQRDQIRCFIDGVQVGTSLATPSGDYQSRAMTSYIYTSDAFYDGAVGPAFSGATAFATVASYRIYNAKEFQVAKTGTTDTTTQRVVELFYHNHSVYHEAINPSIYGAPGWWSWSGTAWIDTPSPLTPTESTDGTDITTAGTIIYASQTPGQPPGPTLDQWTFTSGGIVTKNSQPAGFSSGVNRMYYAAHFVYQSTPGANELGVTPGWWRWDGTTWVATQPPQPAQKSITISTIPQQTVGVGFTVTGTLNAYPTAPTLQYRDNAGAYVALPGGALVTATSFSFAHPSIGSASAAFSVGVRDASLTTISNTSNSFAVVTAGSVTLTGITLSGTSIIAGAAAGTPIGTIAVQATGGTFSGSLAVNDTAHFQIGASSALQNSTTLSTGSYPINLTATMSGATGSPRTQAFTITAAASGNASVNLSSPTGQVMSRYIWGLSTGAIAGDSTPSTEFNNATIPAVQTSLAKLRPTLMRINADQGLYQSYSANGITGIMDKWWNNDTKFMDPAYRFVVGVGWPWPGGSPQQAASWAATFANGMKNAGHEILYWEVGNEPAGGWDVNTYSSYFNAIADALHSINPAYKVGGPNTQWFGEYNDAQWINGGANQVFNGAKRLGFYVAHSYNIDPGDTTHDLKYAKASGIGTGVRDMLDANGMSGCPIYMNEYNMDGLVGREPLQGTYVGAIYAALMLHNSFADLGSRFEGAGLWDAYSNTNYGVVANNALGSNDSIIDLQGYYLGKGGQTLFGAAYQSSTTIANMKILALKPTSTTFAIQLINYDSSANRTVNLSLVGGTPSSTISRWEIGKSSPTTPTISTQPGLGSISVPSESIVILTGQVS